MAMCKAAKEHGLVKISVDAEEPKFPYLDLYERQIEMKYLIQKDLRSKLITPKLNLNQADQEFFESMILKPVASRGTLKPTRESHERLLLAQRMAKEHLLKITRGKSNPDERVHDRIDFFDKRPN